MRRSLAFAVVTTLLLPACTSGSLERVSASPTPAVGTATPTPEPSPTETPAPSPTPSPTVEPTTPSPSPQPAETPSPGPTTPPIAGSIHDLFPSGGLPSSLGATLILLLDRLLDAEVRAAEAEAVVQALREEVARLQAQVDALQQELLRQEVAGS